MILFLVVGCTWIGDDDYTSRIPLTDDDKDGIIERDDCNDDNENIGPGFEEIFYNGIDENCDGKDDFDQDEDSFVSNDNVGKITNGVSNSGQLQGGDCDDTDSTIYPGAEDTWYDGIDSNCDEADDYDQDKDGFIEDQYVGLSPLPGGDCNDLNAEYNPDGYDVPYDGIDSNCDGLDDYDSDGDGYIPSEYEEAHKSVYGTNPDGSALVQIGDCNDNNEDIHPDQTETWYDGIDSNCDGLNDYDQDGDGYVSDEHGLNSGLPTGDCDDTNAERTPDGIELLSDVAVDRDCDGSGTTFSLELMDYNNFDILNSPPDSYIPLAIGGNDTHYYVATISNREDSNAYPLAIAFDRISLEPTEYFSWATIPFPFTALLDIEVTNDYFIGLFGEFNTNLDRWLHLTARSFSDSTITHRRAFTGIPAAPYDDLSLLIESNSGISRVHAIGCVDTPQVSTYANYTLQYAMNPLQNFFNENGLKYESKYASGDSPDYRMSRCKIFTNENTGSNTTPTATIAALREDENGVNELVFFDFNLTTVPQPNPAPDLSESLLLSPTTFSGGLSFAPDDILLLDKYSNLPLLVRVGNDLVLLENGVEDWSITDDLADPLPNNGLTHIHSQMTDDGMLLIGYANSNGDGTIVYGDPTLGVAGLETFHITVDFSVEELVVQYDDGRILVVARGTDEVAFGFAEY